MSMCMGYSTIQKPATSFRDCVIYLAFLKSSIYTFKFQ